MRRCLLLLPALIPHNVSAQQPDPTIVRKVFSSDTISALVMMALSPDDRWLVFVRPISNQEGRVLIVPVAGGEPRELDLPRGSTFNPRFTPQGDKLVFLSSVPRRGVTDDRLYLMSAPFDARTGTLTGPARQISLDGVAGTAHRMAISPDGQSIAYVECCSSGDLKVVPTGGGNARTLAEAGQPMAPLHWTSDSRNVQYHLREGTQFQRRQVPAAGGPSTPLASFARQPGPRSPDQRYSFGSRRSTGNRPWTLELRTGNDEPLGEIDVPSGLFVNPGFSLSSKYIMGRTDNTVAAIRVVPVAGGPSRAITPADDYAWPHAWSSDGNAVYVVEERNRDPDLRLVDVSGKVRRSVPMTAHPREVSWIGMNDDYVVYRGLVPEQQNQARFMARRSHDGVISELDRGYRGDCCDPVGAGGMYYGLYGGEFFYRKLSGRNMEIWAGTPEGTRRKVGDIPATTGGRTVIAVFGNRIAYTDEDADSVKVRLAAAPGATSRRLAAYPKLSRVSDMSWSHDGRQLMMQVAGTGTAQLVFHRFDANGALQGSPLIITPAFEYFYETYWLPDGSGVTTLAQPRGAAMTHIAVIRLQDPENPVLLTRDDPNGKWGYSLSPDGKYVAYPSEQLRGSAFYLIDVAALSKKLGVKN